MATYPNHSFDDRDLAPQGMTLTPAVYETNLSCMQDIGLQWLMDKGKVATQEAYPYQGVDNFCTEKGRDHINFDVSPVHIISRPQCLNVNWPEHKHHVQGLCKAACKFPTQMYSTRQSTISAPRRAVTQSILDVSHVCIIDGTVWVLVNMWKA